MAQVDHAYARLVHAVLTTGEERQSRAGPTIGVFGAGIVLTMNDAFPILTTRKIYPKGVIGELAAFITGSTLLKTFKDFGCNYWDANAAAWPRNEGKPVEQQRVGRIYGTQWRSWAGWYDQLLVLVNGIKADPNGRRHLLSTWNPSDLPDMCLPPCHLLAQFYVLNRRLHCLVYMRSVDLALGLPSDMILYGVLQTLIAKECNLDCGTLQFSFGDCHIYKNHVELLQEQISRPTSTPSAQLVIAERTDLFKFKPTDVEIVDYEPQAAIAYPFNV